MTAYSLWWWIITVATWIGIGTSFLFALKSRRYLRRIYDRNRELQAMTTRAMDRADWALNGMEIVLSWARVNEISTAEHTVRVIFTDPPD